MTNVNLLDWREKNRQIKNNRFFAMLGAAVLSCAVLTLFVNLVIGELVSSRANDVIYLSSEIAAVEQKIKIIKNLDEQKKLLLARRGVIESLQDSRPFVVKIFDNISQIVPAGVVLNEMSRKADILTLSGSGASNLDVSELIKNIQRLRWVESAKLTEIKSASQKTAGVEKGGSNNQSNDRVDFKIEATLVKADKSDEITAGANSDSTAPSSGRPQKQVSRTAVPKAGDTATSGANKPGAAN